MILFCHVITGLSLSYSIISGISFLHFVGGESQVMEIVCAPWQSEDSERHWKSDSGIMHASILIILYIYIYICDDFHFAKNFLLNSFKVVIAYSKIHEFVWGRDSGLSLNSYCLLAFLAWNWDHIMFVPCDSSPDVLFTLQKSVQSNREELLLCFITAWNLFILDSVSVFRRQHPGGPEAPDDVWEVGRFLRVSSWQHGIFWPVRSHCGGLPSPCWHHPQLHSSHSHLLLSGQESLAARQWR